MRILLFGIGGHAKTVADAVRCAGGDVCVGVVSHDGRPCEILPGLPVVGSNDDFPALLARRPADAAFIALGDATVRARLAERIAPHLPFARVVHPRAVVSESARIGDGSLVLAGAVINPGTWIGSHCIVNTSASVDHDCRLEDFVHICPGAVLAGHVTVGARSWVGIGSVLSDHVTVGRDVFLGAGSIVVKDVPDGARVVGGRRSILKGRSEPLR